MRGFLTVCSEPDCPELVKTGRCPKHQAEYAAEVRARTVSWSWVYHDPRWYALKKRVRLEQLTCDTDGCYEIWTDLDHIDPVSSGGAPFDRSNVHGLCRRHHSAKTSAEVRGEGR